MRHIVIATAGSELAGKAVVEGIRPAPAPGARVTFLTVNSPLATLSDQDAAFVGLPEAVRHQALANLGSS